MALCRCVFVAGLFDTKALRHKGSRGYNAQFYSVCDMRQTNQEHFTAKPIK